ncbi:hypothetical protein CDEF62S_05423 [Castellaniella defragrans]
MMMPVPLSPWNMTVAVMMAAPHEARLISFANSVMAFELKRMGDGKSRPL